MNILQWESVSEYLTDAVPAARAYVGAGSYAEERVTRVADKALRGDPDLLKAARTVLLSVASQLSTEVKPRTVSHVAGGSVNVGRYIAGLPDCMRRRIPTPTETRHVKIIVNTGLSGGVTGNAAATRAALIIGLISRLQAEGISLSLYLYEDGGAPKGGLAERAKGKTWAKRLKSSDSTGDYCQMIKLATSPVNLSQAAYLLTQPEVFRDLMLNAACGEFSGYHAGGWPDTQDKIGRPRWAQVSRGLLGLAPTDLYIASFHLHDVGMTPQAWIDTYAKQALGKVAA